MKKTLIIFFVFVISWTVNALGVEAITENGKRVLLKNDGTWKYIETKNPGAFDVIVGEWISVEDSSGEYFLVNFDGQVCFKERIYEDPCYDFSFIELGDNQFGMKGDDRYLFEFDEDLIFGFKNGEKFATYKKY